MITWRCLKAYYGGGGVEERYHQIFISERSSIVRSSTAFYFSRADIFISEWEK
jgi:hypothetical protein